MNELIKITTTEDGTRLVSARDLYLGLGLNKTQWSRWYQSNIEKNDFFKESIDFTGVRHYVEGNEIQDFAISIEFAKHIAMMARTEKSHEYRNYFIKCEEVAKDTTLNTSKLSKELKAILMLDEKTVEMDNRLTKLEDNMTIDHGQACNVKLAADMAVKRLCCGNESAAYQNQTLRRKIYSFVWRSLKSYFNVTAYHNILRKDMDKAINYVSNLSLQGGLLREVQEINNQMCFGKEVI